MPKIGEVQRGGKETLEVPGLSWLQEALHGGLVRGGVYLARRVLSEGQEYHGIRVLVYDSIQGRGLAATATQQYKSLYKFNDLAKNVGVCTLLIGHITKRGQVAGPKDLEHNIDAMVYLRRAFRLRPLFVPKNRFGPAIFDPLALTMDDHGRLSKAPHTTAQSSVVFGWSRIGENLTEAQAAVSLPRYGSNPELNAPNLPRARVKQLMNTISQLKDVDVTNLSYTINCFLPRRERYAEELDLLLAVALLGSYLQQPIPHNSLFVGELDLTSRIRRPDPNYLAELAQVLVKFHQGTIQRVYLSTESEKELKDHLAEQEKAARAEGVEIKDRVQVIGVRNLPGLLNLLWPQIGVTG